MADYLNRCHFGDVRDVLRRMIADGVKVNCIVTSPPYWGLRSYLPADHTDKALELGSEPTLREFLDTMVGVFDLCRQVLADDGTMWVNMGDSYAGSWGAQSRGGAPSSSSTLQGNGHIGGGPKLSKLSEVQVRAAPKGTHTGTVRDAGIKPKDLMGQPWRLAFALQDAGWWLRQNIIWAKPNPMPESIRDRCTKAHEYLFLLTKSERYFWDFEAMQEPVNGGAHARRASNGVGFGYADPEPKSRTIKAPDGWASHAGGHGSFHKNGREKGKYGPLTGRDTDGVHRTKAGLNLPNVGHREGPPGNPAPKQLLANTENPGAYADGKSERMGRGAGWRKLAEAGSGTKNNENMDEALAQMPATRNRRSVWTIPSKPYSEAHFATFPPALIEPCILGGSRPGDVVFDPFMGSGTTAMVAEQLGRQWIGIDIDQRNEALQRGRLTQPCLELAA